MSRRRITLLLLGAVGSLFVYYLYGGSSTPAGQQPLGRLDTANVSSLKDAFNASASSVRLLVLVSPT